MKQSINFSQFCDTFRSMGRDNKFSYDAQKLIFDYMEECNPDYELDVIAICCEYSEDTEDQIVKYYGLPEDQDVTEYLERHTSIIGVTDAGSIVYAQF